MDKLTNEQKAQEKQLRKEALADLRDEGREQHWKGWMKGRYLEGVFNPWYHVFIFFGCGFVLGALVGILAGHEIAIDFLAQALTALGFGG